MPFNLLIVRLFYNLTGRKGKESFKKSSIIAVLHGKFFSYLLLFQQNERKQFNFISNLIGFHLEMVILCGIFITRNNH